MEESDKWKIKRRNIGLELLKAAGTKNKKTKKEKTWEWTKSIKSWRLFLAC